MKSFTRTIPGQSTPDGSLAIRFFEYDSQIALDNGELEEYRLTVRFPHSGVLYLRHTGKTPERMEIHIQTPGGEISYEVPIMKVQRYSLDDIFARNLLFLLPFYIFSHEKRFREYERDEKKLKELKQEYRMIHNRLEILCCDGKISEYEKCTITDMMKRVIEKIAAEYETVRKEVRNAMGGQILEHEAKTILRKGITEGFSQGINQGRIEMLVNLILRKKKKGYPAEVIAEQIEEPVEYVRKIIEIAEGCGIDAELQIIVEKILQLDEKK